MCNINNAVWSAIGVSLWILGEKNPTTEFDVGSGRTFQ